MAVPTPGNLPCSYVVYKVTWEGCAAVFHATELPVDEVGLTL